mgnify:CR=1 FL=1
MHSLWSLWLFHPFTDVDERFHRSLEQFLEQLDIRGRVSAVIRSVNGLIFELRSQGMYWIQWNKVVFFDFKFGLTLSWTANGFSVEPGLVFWIYFLWRDLPFLTNCGLFLPKCTKHMERKYSYPKVNAVFGLVTLKYPVSTYFCSLSEKKIGTWKILHSHGFGRVSWKSWAGLPGEFSSLKYSLASQASLDSFCFTSGLFSLCWIGKCPNPQKFPSVRFGCILGWGPIQIKNLTVAQWFVPNLIVQ